MKRHRSSSRGFTLIELLVVVAIIALLISILLPSLARAKEQAKIAKCVSNLRNMCTGGNQYALEFDDYPWVVRSRAPYTFQVITELIYAGAMPNKTTSEHNNFFPGGSLQLNAPTTWDVYRLPPRFRPLNKYMSASITWDAEPNPSPASPRQIPAETPEFFKDPSDSHPYVPTVGAVDPPITGEPESVSNWDFYGNSYAINWYWPYYYQRSGPNGGAEPGWNTGPYGPYGQFGAVIGYDEGGGGASARRGAGRKMMRNKDGRFASEFILFYEENLNFALEGAKPPGHPPSGSPWGNEPAKRLMGWHGQQDRHAAGYMDGSARYATMDTRYVYGTGWTIWPNKPWTGAWAAYNDFAPGN